MKKKVIILIAILIIGIVGIVYIFSFGAKWLFSEQYNENGISHFLVITIDKNQSREYVGELDGHRIYVENLNLEETNFRTVNAENMSIKEAIEKNLVSIEEWRKYAWKNKKDGDAEILQFENYEIVIANGECIIRPLAR
ncbi:MAG: hypothetical protein IJ890_09005 [Clostridia bacterium]|nr:hypothetical protein [Clostridia bacterium]